MSSNAFDRLLADEQKAITRRDAKTAKNRRRRARVKERKRLAHERQQELRREAIGHAVLDRELRAITQ